ncbi:MAG: hypothetical protein Q9201_003302 [Fulgogasparrea decipioides]
MWVGASNTLNYKYPGINTLVQFYVIYVPNLTKWDKLDLTEDHKDELVALQATLETCLYTYSTNMTFGVARTTEVSKMTDLDWQTGESTFDDKKTTFATVTTTHKSEEFWMSSASMRSKESTPDVGGNITDNDNVRIIAESIYDDHAGIKGLSKLLENLSVSMSNAMRTVSDLPGNVSGTSSSFEVYIEIQWAWMIVPIAAVVLSLIFLLSTIYLSRRSKIPAWKSSLLAHLSSLNTEMRKDVGGMREPLSMKNRAKSLNVRLEADDRQWQIVKAD